MTTNTWNYDSYFSIHDILTTEETLSCTFEQDLPNLGFLSLDNEDKDLKSGSKLEIPLWLIESLTRNRVPIIKCDLPKIYKEDYRDILEAGSHAVNLNKWNQHYYEMGLYYQQITSNPTDDTNKVAEFLYQVFKSRFKLVMDWVQKQDTLDSVVQYSLTYLENKVCSRGKKGEIVLLNWLNSGIKEIETSFVLHNLRKRKRVDF